MRLTRCLAGFSSALGTLALGSAVFAQAAVGDLEILGKPIDGRMGFQPAATSTARDLQWLDAMLIWVSGAIVLLVTLLLVAVALRYNRKANPVPARFTHNAPLEIAWTIVPVVILVFIGAYSLPILFKDQEIPPADLTIKVTGNQWYWSYEYPDQEFGFDSFMLTRDQLEEYGYTQAEYLLATDTAMVVPVNKTVVVQVTGADVIHSWKIPAFGVMQDGVPGRLAELWFKAEKEGVYFGQCSELCGKDHAYMPITVKVVSEAAYAEWLTSARAEYAGLPPAVDLASAD